MVIGAYVPEDGPGVGCFDPAEVLRRLGEAFGPDLEYDLTDELAGVHDRVRRTAADLGLPADSLPVLSAGRVERVEAPRYAFRLRVGGPAGFVTGRVDRYSIEVACEGAAFPEPARGQFIAFLRSLRLGRVVRHGCDAESGETS